jgi:hypothetical protein
LKRLLRRKRKRKKEDNIMATRKDRILNLVVDTRYKEILKKHADKRGVSISQVIRDYVDKQLSAEPDSVKVVLSIPNSIVSNAESLEKWLNTKVQALMQHFKNGSH